VIITGLIIMALLMWVAVAVIGAVVAIGAEVMDLVKEEVIDLVKEEVMDLVKEEVMDLVKEEVMDLVKEEVTKDLEMHPVAHLPSASATGGTQYI